MKTYIIGAPYSVRIENEESNIQSGYARVNAGGTHFFKCDLDLSDLPGSLEKIQSRCKKMSRNLNGCKISFAQGRGRTLHGHEKYSIHTPTEELLRTFVAGDWVDTDLTSSYDITKTVSLCVYDSQNTVRSKIERSIHLRNGHEYDDTTAQYDCILDKHGEFIKEVA